MGEAKPHEFPRLGHILVAVIVAALGFYVSVIVAVAGLVPQSQLADYELPAMQAFNAAFGSQWMTNMILFVGFLGLMSVWNATFFAVLRVLEGMGKEGLLSTRWADRLNASRSPIRPLLVASAASLVGAFLGRAILMPVISVSGLCVTLLFLFVCTACLVRRIRHPSVPAPFQAPGGRKTIICGISLAATLVCVSVFAILSGSNGFFSPELTVVLVWALMGWMVWRRNGARFDAGRPSKPPARQGVRLH